MIGWQNRPAVRYSLTMLSRMPTIGLSWKAGCGSSRRKFLAGSSPSMGRQAVSFWGLF